MQAGTFFIKHTIIFIFTIIRHKRWIPLFSGVKQRRDCMECNNKRTLKIFTNTSSRLSQMHECEYGMYTFAKAIQQNQKERKVSALI